MAKDDPLKKLDINLDQLPKSISRVLSMECGESQFDPLYYDPEIIIDTVGYTDVKHVLKVKLLEEFFRCNDIIELK